MMIRKLRRARILLNIREVFSRLKEQPLESFPVSAQDPGREVVMAICGKFWAISGNILDVPVEVIPLFQKSGYSKAYWNFYIEPMDKGQSRLITETRVQVYGEAERKKFALYWHLVGPFNGCIRAQILKAIERDAMQIRHQRTSPNNKRIEKRRLRRGVMLVQQEQAGKASRSISQSEEKQSKKEMRLGLGFH